MESGLQSVILSAPSKKSKNGPSYRNPFDVKDEVEEKYENLWSDLEKKFKAVHVDLSRRFVSDITTYIKSYEFTGQSIPTLALLTGVNVADHTSLFKFIRNEVKSVTKYPIVFIRSCHDTTVKPVIERLVQSFLVSEDEPENSDETDPNGSEDDEDVMTKMKKWKCTLARLHLWYQSKRENKEDYSPLIVVIPDLESFSRKVMNDLFCNLSVYRDRLPFILLLGIASDLNALHQRVALSVLQNYDTVIFKTEPAVKFLDLVLEKIFLTADCPFQLHGKVLDQLIEAFGFYNFSVEYFVRGIQFCLINHFLSAKINILCCPLDDIEHVVNSLDTKDLNDLLKLPSVGQLNTRRKNENLSILNKKNIKTQLVLFMKDLHQSLTRFHVAIRCFYVIVKSIPKDFFGKKLRNIYCKAMQMSITKSDEFKECMALLKCFSSENILKTIDAIKELLVSYEDDPIFAEKLKKLNEFRHTIESLINEVDNKSSSPRKRKLSPTTMSNSIKKSSKKDQSSVQENIVEEELSSLKFTLEVKYSSDDDSQNCSLSIQEDPQKSLVGQNLNNEMNSLRIEEEPRKLSFGQEGVDSTENLSSLKNDINLPSIRNSPRKSSFPKKEPTTPQKVLSSSNVRSSPRKLPYTSMQLMNVSNAPTDSTFIDVQNSPRKPCNGFSSSVSEELTQVSPSHLRCSPRKSSHLSATPSQPLNESNAPTDSPVKGVQNSPCKLLNRPPLSANERSTQVSPPHLRCSPRKLSHSSATPSQSVLSTPKNIQNSASKTPSSRSEFRQMLFENTNQRKSLSESEQQKYNLVEFFSTSFFGELLECPTMYPFHEVLFYKDAEYVKRHYTSVNQRNEIEKALLDPHNYLECKCCKKKTPDDFPETMPDLCISYRLLLEHVSDAENISLKDWLHSFDLKVSGMESEEITVEVYNRFKQTTKELQLMGFIEPHKTKVDHVRNVDAVRNLKSKVSTLPW